MNLFHVSLVEIDQIDPLLYCVHYITKHIQIHTHSNFFEGGLPDCAPGKCPKTAEISPIKCSSDPVLFFNNGYPMLCQEGFTCDTAAADAGEGNPCRASEDGAGYE